MNPEDALVLFVCVVAAAAIAVVVLAGLKRLSKPRAAWYIRGAAGAAGALLLVLAVLNPDPIAAAGDHLFKGPAGTLAADDAVILARLLLVVIALGFLIIPGTWMDVATGTLVALAVAGFIGNYKDTRALLACPEPVDKARPCPTPTPKIESPIAREQIAIELPKDKVVPPLNAITGSKAVVRPVVELKGDEGILTTETHRYTVGLAGDVPAKKLTGNVTVNVYVTTGKFAENLLADVTAAKTIYLTPD